MGRGKVSTSVHCQGIDITLRLSRGRTWEEVRDEHKQSLLQEQSSGQAWQQWSSSSCLRTCWVGPGWSVSQSLFSEGSREVIKVVITWRELSGSHEMTTPLQVTALISGVVCQGHSCSGIVSVPHHRSYWSVLTFLDSKVSAKWMAMRQDA
jgi:hypothetical protein